MPTKKTSRTRELQSIPIKKFIDDLVYRIDLDADYQREKIWSRRNQEDLLDSIVQNIDIPKIYLARVESHESFDYECIDGKQRMATLLSFYKPEPSDENRLRVKIAGDKYTYAGLQSEMPRIAERMDNFELTFVIYPANLDEEFIRDIFRRLQLGVRLNSGELLKTHSGTIRDFVYKEMGKEAPFLRNTKLSDRRFSREFTLAQICINSFSLNDAREFVRARYDDLEDFFKEKYDLDPQDSNLARIRSVLKLLDRHFGERASSISSRAVAVSAYLFAEDLFIRKESDSIPRFADFFVKLLETIREDLQRLSNYESPRNPLVLEEFQKHISQASVESHAIKRRSRFLTKAFGYFMRRKTKGKIIGTP